MELELDNLLYRIESGSYKMYPQTIANALISASLYWMIGIGFVIIYRTGRFWHLAHAAVFACAPYFYYVLCNLWGLSPAMSLSAAIILGTTIGFLIEVFVYRRLRHRGSSSVIMFLASLAVYIILQNAITAIFGPGTKIIRPPGLFHTLEILGARLTSIQAITVGVGLISVVLVHIFLEKSRIGLAIRATANNNALAATCGVDNDRIMSTVILVGSCLAAVAGILYSLDMDLRPTIGMSPLLMSIVAVFVGGTVRASGLLWGAVIVALIVHSASWVTDAKWQDAIAFALLLLCMMIRTSRFANIFRDRKRDKVN